MDNFSERDTKNTANENNVRNTDTYTLETVQFFRSLETRESDKTSESGNSEQSNSLLPDVEIATSTEDLDDPNNDQTDGAELKTGTAEDGEQKAGSDKAGAPKPATVKDEEPKDGAGKDGQQKAGSDKDGKAKPQSVKDGEPKEGDGKDGEQMAGSAKDGKPKPATVKDGEPKDGAGKDGAPKSGAEEAPKHSEKDMQQHINNLASDDFQTRENAQKSLEEMGPSAVPALEKAQKDSKDPEVRRRAEAAITAIRHNAETTNNKNYLDKANKSEASIDQLLAKSGTRFEYSTSPNLVASPDGEVSALSKVQLVVGDPKGQLSDAEKKSAEELIKLGDSLKNDQKFAQAKTSLESKDKFGADAKNDAEKINKLALISESGREIYAKALSNSDKPADQKRGIELLTEQIKGSKKEPDWSEKDTAARLGADQNKNFREAFKNAGGNLRELDRLAEEYRERKATPKRR